MKEKIKEILADVVYCLYQKKILKNRIAVCSVDDTIDALINTDNSLVRFGDGEIVLIAGIASVTQPENKELSKRLVEVIESDEDNLLIAVYDIFQGMSHLHRKSQVFWRKHLLKYRKYYNRYCKPDRKYYNTFMSRCYYSMKDRSDCSRWFEKIKSIWEGKPVVVVEGERTHNGVENDMLNKASLVKRVLCPSRNAFAQYNQILQVCQSFGKENLFLLSIGAAAKPLAYDLFQRGYRVIDIGNLDLEYEWYLRKSEGKMALKKHDIIGEEANKNAGYHEYLSQVAAIIQEAKHAE